IATKPSATNHGQYDATSWITGEVKCRPSVVPTTTSPALRPQGKTSRFAPAICASAMATIEPIIHGSGEWIQAKSAPPAAQTRRPAVIRAARERIVTREWLGVGGNAIILCFRGSDSKGFRNPAPEFASPRPGSSVGRAED